MCLAKQLAEAFIQFKGDERRSILEHYKENKLIIAELENKNSHIYAMRDESFLLLEPEKQSCGVIKPEDLSDFMKQLISKHDELPGQIIARLLETVDNLDIETLTRIRDQLRKCT